MRFLCFFIALVLAAALPAKAEDLYVDRSAPSGGDGSPDTGPRVPPA